MSWRDDNWNGLQDAGEPGQPGVQVQLFTDRDDFVAAATSAAEGYYNFPGLTPGSYYLGFPPTVFPWKLRLAEQDPTVEVDSDASTDTGHMPVFTIVALQELRNLDAGYVVVRPGLGDYVFEDLNLDGVQTAGEPGVPGVAVERYTASGVLLDMALNGEGGYYQFNETPPGDYYLKFSLTAQGMVLTQANATPDDLNDSDPTA